jgi:cytochrome c-type biogenesis protein CcmH/NrfF
VTPSSILPWAVGASAFWVTATLALWLAAALLLALMGWVIRQRQREAEHETKRVATTAATAP